MGKYASFLKLSLVVLFLLCLVNMPYGFFQLVRFIAFFSFGILAFEAHKNKNQSSVFIYLGLAILFQPFLKIALGRQIWNVVDVLVSIGLIISLFIKTNGKTF